MIKIAITSIGSGVGQSIVDSCHNSQIPMEIFGLGMNPLGFGAFDCDFRLSLPTIYDHDYVETLLTYCKKYQFNILIPGLDDELILLSEYIQEFNALGVEIPISGPEIIKLCRNKELMSQELLQVSSAFVKCYGYNDLKTNPSSLPYPLIAKPNSGFASRNIFTINNQEDLQDLKPFHIVQTLAIHKTGNPKRDTFLKAFKTGNILQTDEISIQLLYSKNGKELGRMASLNKLKNGIPIEIIPIQSIELWNEIDSVVQHFKKLGLKGPLNIQGRLTDNGFKIFEMNPRFTGITGLRALMGFNEVEAIIKDYCNLYKNNSPLKINQRRIGIRQVTNRVVDIKRDNDLYNEVRTVDDYPIEVSEKSTILVTGANGYLGLATVEQLVKSQKVGKVKVVVRNSERFKNVCKNFFPDEVEIYDINELFNGQLTLGSIDIVCHLASGRPIHGTGEIATSLAFTNKLMLMIGKYHVPAVINVSSQAVYGSEQISPWKESDQIFPETAYAQSKWAGELLTQNAKSSNNITSAISLRLCRVIGASKSMGFDVVPHLFIKKAILQEPITIQGGTQKFDYLDVKDAAKAIVKLVDTPHQNWPDVLNIGSGKQVSLLEITELISKVSEKELGKKLDFTVEENFVKLEFGMSIDKAKHTIGWEPKIMMEETISELFKYMKKKKEKNDL